MEVGSVGGEGEKMWSGDERGLFVSPELAFFTLVGHGILNDGECMLTLLLLPYPHNVLG